MYPEVERMSGALPKSASAYNEDYGLKVGHESASHENDPEWLQHNLQDEPYVCHH